LFHGCFYLLLQVIFIPEKARDYSKTTEPTTAEPELEPESFLKKK
jgi:hypothetical protein